MNMRIHLLGPSGSGVTTLGKELAFRFGAPYFDSDDIFWEETDPPFTTKRPKEKRILMLASLIDSNESWVIGGSALGWGDRLLDASTLIVYLYTKPELRIPRLLERERERFGDRIDPGGDMHESHKEFIAWARGYEKGGPDTRSRASESEWMGRAKCAVLSISGEVPVAAEAERVLRALGMMY